MMKEFILLICRPIGIMLKVNLVDYTAQISHLELIRIKRCLETSVDLLRTGHVDPNTRLETSRFQAIRATLRGWSLKTCLHIHTETLLPRPLEKSIRSAITSSPTRGSFRKTLPNTKLNISEDSSSTLR